MVVVICFQAKTFKSLISNAMSYKEKKNITRNYLTIFYVVKKFKSASEKPLRRYPRHEKILWRIEIMNKAAFSKWAALRIMHMVKGYSWSENISLESIEKVIALKKSEVSAQWCTARWRSFSKKCRWWFTIVSSSEIALIRNENCKNQFQFLGKPVYTESHNKTHLA